MCSQGHGARQPQSPCCGKGPCLPVSGRYSFALPTTDSNRPLGSFLPHNASVSKERPWGISLFLLDTLRLNTEQQCEGETCWWH